MPRSEGWVYDITVRFKNMSSNGKNRKRRSRLRPLDLARMEGLDANKEKT